MTVDRSKESTPRRPRWSRRIPFIAAIIWIAATGGSVIDHALADASESTRNRTCSVIGFSTPFRTATLATLQQGRITTIDAEEGQSVAQGDLLVGLDADVQRTRTEIAQRAAESTLAVDIARVRMDRAREELERIERLRGGSMATSKELSEARADADELKLAYELARFEHDQAVRDHTLQQQILAQHEIRAPFAGYVSTHLKQLGETVEEREGVLTLVQLDPLLVTIDCPLENADMVRQGTQVTVRPVDSRWAPRTGTVRFINRVADAGSQTFKVKLEVPNPDAGWLAGMKVEVVFGPPMDTASNQQAKPDRIARKQNARR